MSGAASLWINTKAWQVAKLRQRDLVCVGTNQDYTAPWKKGLQWVTTASQWDRGAQPVTCETELIPGAGSFSPWGSPGVCGDPCGPCSVYAGQHGAPSQHTGLGIGGIWPWGLDPRVWGSDCDALVLAHGAKWRWHGISGLWSWHTALSRGAAGPWL